MQDEHVIDDIAKMEAIIGTPHDVIRSKIAHKLDDLMIEFITRSPLVFVSTCDPSGEIDVSPKGDPAGFVQVGADGSLSIPERPGNQLAIGFHNILDNGRIGLIFVVPNQRETLRVRGNATLRKDPDVLESMRVDGKPALLYTHVEVTQCFIHCGKAMVRSNLWKPETWASADRSIGGRQLARVVGARSDEEVKASAERLEMIYKHTLY